MHCISYLVWAEGNVHTAILSDFRYNKRIAKGKTPIFMKHYGKAWGKHFPHKVYVKLYNNAIAHIRNN